MTTQCVYTLHRRIACGLFENVAVSSGYKGHMIWCLEEALVEHTGFQGVLGFDERPCDLNKQWAHQLVYLAFCRLQEVCCSASWMESLDNVKGGIWDLAHSICAEDLTQDSSFQRHRNEVAERKTKYKKPIRIAGHHKDILGA